MRALGFLALDGAAGEQLHRVLNMVPKGALEDSTLRFSDAGYYVFDHAELVTDHVTAVFAEHLMLFDMDGVLSSFW